VAERGRSLRRRRRRAREREVSGLIERWEFRGVKEEEEEDEEERRRKNL
jgi:hypothetical protein